LRTRLPASSRRSSSQGLVSAIHSGIVTSIGCIDPIVTQISFNGTFFVQSIQFTGRSSRSFVIFEQVHRTFSQFTGRSPGTSPIKVFLQPNSSCRSSSSSCNRSSSPVIQPDRSSSIEPSSYSAGGHTDHNAVVLVLRHLVALRQFNPFYSGTERLDRLQRDVLLRSIVQFTAEHQR
jgi:hypothetical protein